MGRIINQQFAGTLLNLGSVLTLGGTFTQYYDRSGVLYNLTKHRQMPVGWYETDGYREQASYNDRRAVRHFIGPWSTRLIFEQWALGSAYVTSEGLKRTPPAQHPEMPWLYCTDVDQVLGQGIYVTNQDVRGPDGTVLGMIAYTARGEVQRPPERPNDLGQPGDPGFPFPPDPPPTDPIGQSVKPYDALSCRMAVTYGLPGYDILTDDEMITGKTELDRYVTKVSQASMQALMIPGTQLRFRAPGKSWDEQPISQSGQQIYMPCEELTYTWHNVPTIPQAAIDTCMGCVNSAVFDPNSRLKPGGYPVGSLLCQAPQKVPKRTSEGLWVFDLAYKLLYRPTLWNMFPAQDGLFYGAYFPTSPPGVMFPPADFASLFVALP